MEKNLVIQRAWKAIGVDFDIISDAVDYNGWLSHNSISPEINENQISVSKEGVRPKSLDGLEKNNGWTKIEKWKRLPKKSFFCAVIMKTGRKTVGQYVHTMNQFCILRTGYVDISKVTHYAEFENHHLPHF